MTSPASLGRSVPVRLLLFQAPHRQRETLASGLQPPDLQRAATIPVGIFPPRARCSLISIISISIRAAFIRSYPFRNDIKHVLKGNAVSIFSRFTHHNTFPFQLRLFSVCASHSKICHVKDQLERACFERPSSSAPSCPPSPPPWCAGFLLGIVAPTERRT